MWYTQVFNKGLMLTTTTYIYLNPAISNCLEAKFLLYVSGRKYVDGIFGIVNVSLFKPSLGYASEPT